jgi:hypothetical protein
LIGNRFKSAITAIKALRGPYIGSDHNLKKISFNMKLRVKTGNKYDEKRKIVNIFQKPKWKQEYATETNNRFAILENMDDDEDDSDNNIDEKWESINIIIKEIKQQLTEKDGSMKTLKTRWYDEECKTAIEEIKKTKEKWLQGRRKNGKQGVSP